jgi:MOB kinase activator 1
VNVNIDLESNLNSNSRTRAPFKPQKAGRGTSSWQLKQFAEATLGSGSLRKAVKLPEGEDEDEWLAVNGMFRELHGRSRRADFVTT